MSTLNPIRVRFAPSPTGIMHLGNVRAALINYLFALKKQGVFILRIEDTDFERNSDVYTKQIIEDLKWLGLSYSEGPPLSGPYAPYFQSQRTAIYQEHLSLLVQKPDSVYRCFCTIEEIERKRQRQIALKQPPRYDRLCSKLTAEHIAQNLEKNMPFIWRFKLPESVITITDSARGKIEFDLRKISDFALTRANGTFTFMFANFVDDLTMRISNVIRGEDHLTNTAGQAALYQAFQVDLPLFLHLPIIVNTDGKKLSKRDFGFSLQDLKDGGFLPQAICNYLAIIGSSFAVEIGSTEEIAQSLDFETMHSSGQITYDIEKLRWVNHHWIMKQTDKELVTLALPFLLVEYPEIKNVDSSKLEELARLIKPELKTLVESVEKLAFFFKKPVLKEDQLEELDLTSSRSILHEWVSSEQDTIFDAEAYTKALQMYAKEKDIPMKKFFMLLRIALTGKPDGLSIKDLGLVLGNQEYIARLQQL